MSNAEFTVTFTETNQGFEPDFGEVQLVPTDPGGDGKDGFSPIVNATETADGYRIDITDAEGTESITLRHGKDGSDGAPGKDGSDGAPGPAGPTGKTAYQYAQDGGYTGTEAEFAAKLAQEIPAPYTLPTASADVKGGVMIGAGLEMDGEKVRVAPEGVYELIETITITEPIVLIRDKEPDGTPYNFARVMYEMYTTNESVAGYSLWYYYGSDDVCASCWQNAMSGNTSAKQWYAYSETLKIRGNWRVYARPWQTKKDVTNLYESVLDVTATAVSKIRTWNTLSAGLTIKIWGVRANA